MRSRFDLPKFEKLLLGKGYSDSSITQIKVFLKKCLNNIKKVE